MRGLNWICGLALVLMSFLVSELTELCYGLTWRFDRVDRWLYRQSLHCRLRAFPDMKRSI